MNHQFLPIWQTSTSKQTLAIGVFTDLYRPKIDGVSIVVESFVKEMRGRGIHIDLFAPQMPGTYLDSGNVFRFHSVPAYYDAETRISVPFELKYLKRAFTHPYQVIHSHTPGPLGITGGQISKFRSIPHIHTFHGYLPDYARYFFGDSDFSVSIMNRFSSWWGNQADYLITPSQKIKHWLELNGVEREIRVIPNGINVLTYAPATSFRDRTVKKGLLVNKGWINDDDFVLLYVGRIAKEKSVERLIDFCNPLLNNLRKSKLVLVGDGPDRLCLEEKVRQLGLQGRVIFTGYMPSSSMPSVYHSADIFTFLSTSETQGMVVLEAIASGLPVVVYKDQAFEQMVFDEHNGYIVDSQNQFTDAVTKLYYDHATWDKFSNHGLAIAKDFDIGITINRIMEYYDYVMSNFRLRSTSSSSYVRANESAQLDSGKERD